MRTSAHRSVFSFSAKCIPTADALQWNCVRHRRASRRNPPTVVVDRKRERPGAGLATRHARFVRRRRLRDWAGARTGEFHGGNASSCCHSTRLSAGLTALAPGCARRSATRRAPAAPRRSARRASPPLPVPTCRYLRCSRPNHPSPSVTRIVPARVRFTASCWPRADPQRHHETRRREHIHHPETTRRGLALPRRGHGFAPRKRQTPCQQRAPVLEQQPDERRVSATRGPRAQRKPRRSRPASR